jgi:uncharacterized protein (DUF1778 family)
MKKKTPRQLPAVSKQEVAKQFPKNQAILLRMSAQDKETINHAAKSVHLTTTEFVLKSALAIASKLPKRS